MNRMIRLMGITLLSLFLFFNSIEAQKISVVRGNLSTFKKAEIAHVEFIYDNLKVTTQNSRGKFVTETEEKYKEDVVKRKNKRKAGKGDEWEAAWEADRSNLYEPTFIEAFNSQTKSIQLSHDDSSEIIMVVHTQNIYPGDSVGGSLGKRPIAAVYYEVRLMKGDKVLCKLKIDKSIGNDFAGFDFATSKRLSKSYERAGKALARYVNKKG